MYIPDELQRFIGRPFCKSRATVKSKMENLEQDKIGIGFCLVWLMDAKKRQKIICLQN